MKERVHIRKNMQYYIMLFSVGSIMGWCLEVIFRSVCNGYLRIPGFLMGPYCPIYGIGIVLIVAFCNHSNKLVSFAKIFVLTTALEYIVSFVFESWFQKLLWDYSNLPLSVGTRVSLVFSMAWGLLGMVILVFLQPQISKWYEDNQKISFGIAVSVSSIICIDTIASMLGYVI